MGSIQRKNWASMLLVLLLAAFPQAQAQTVQVTSAVPSTAPQGTVALDVEISGSGFDSTAAVQFLVTGTTNQGGITVRKVSVRGAKKLIATIDVADTAIVDNFDIEVTLSSGRKGKGTTLFAVQAKTADPCNAPGLDFPAIAYRVDQGNLLSKTMLADASGTCTRLLMTENASVAYLSYPINGSTNVGRVVWSTGLATYAIEFTVGPGNSVSVGTKRVVVTNANECCGLDITKDGSAIYVVTSLTGVSRVDLATGAIVPIYDSGDPGWYFQNLSINGDETQLMATMFGRAPNDGASRLVRIDLTTEVPTEHILREGYVGNAYYPSADKYSPRIAFTDYIEGTNNCTPLVVTDYDGNELFPSGLVPQQMGRFPTWLGNDIVLQQRTDKDRRGRCTYTGALSKVDLDTNVETVLIETGALPDGR